MVAAMGCLSFSFVFPGYIAKGGSAKPLFLLRASYQAAARRPFNSAVAW
jgi:hypothetical protein